MYKQNIQGFTKTDDLDDNLTMNVLTQLNYTHTTTQNSYHTQVYAMHVTLPPTYVCGRILMK